jgi:beta-alanine degradation protein BauB
LPGPRPATHAPDRVACAEAPTIGHVSTARATTAVDDDRVRITTWTFAANGEATGWHVHEYDYIVVPVTGGTFAVTGPDGGTRELVQEPGSPYLGRAGTEHDVVNAGEVPATFVEIELKR